MTNKEYRDHVGLSRSQLFPLLNQTPLHFRYQLEHPKADTPALLFGRAAHKYILEEFDFDSEFVIAPNVDRRTKAGKEEYAAFIESAAGREVITADDYMKIKEMADAIDLDPFARTYLDGVHEQSFFWTDSATGEALKVRPDCISEVDGKKYIVDYKTTTSCHGFDFDRDARKRGYDFQAGMYREGVFQNTFEDYGFVFIAQEKEAPYAVRTYICSDGFIEEGYNKFREAVGLYHWCKENDNWFGYEGKDRSISELVEEGEN